MKKRVHVLGVEYSILYLNESEDESLAHYDGYCDWTQKRIVVGRFEPSVGSLGNLEAFQKKILRHEIVHAFLQESGLKENAMRYDGAWADCEEMVDWFAFQGPKIYAAWQEAGAL